MTVEIPEMMRRAMEAQGKVDPDAVAAEAAKLLETGELDKPVAPPVPRPSTPSEVIEGQESLLGVMAPPDRPAAEPDGGMPDDHALYARGSDPGNSHAAGRSVERREGTTATFTPGTHKHKMLAVYAREEIPLTDTQAWTRSGLSYRSGAWHRCSDMLDAAVIREVDSVTDAETGSSVRRCVPTELGLSVLAALDRGETVKL